MSGDVVTLCGGEVPGAIYPTYQTEVVIVFFSQLSNCGSCILVIIKGVFNGSVSDSVYTASSDRMISK